MRGKPRKAIRDSLGSRDRIAVVHFTNSVIHELTVDHSRPDDRQVSRSISNLAPHGSTNVQAGLDLGVKLADQARRERPGAYNYIILMSDGVANVDATNPFAILESAYDPDRGNPLRIITVGVGIQNYNDYLLEQLAQHGDGWYRYLSDAEQARATFNRENWLALSAPFADQARAQVTWDTGRRSGRGASSATRTGLRPTPRLHRTAKSSPSFPPARPPPSSTSLSCTRNGTGCRGVRGWPA